MAKLRNPTLTPAQLEIVQLFWEHGEMGVAQVWELLSKRRSVARNTVQTMLTRLAAKGWLHSRAKGKTFYFRAARPRKSAVHGIVGQFIDTVFAGSASGLVSMLLDSQKLSTDEVLRIRELIDRAEREK